MLKLRFLGEHGVSRRAPLRFEDKTRVRISLGTLIRRVAMKMSILEVTCIGDELSAQQGCIKHSQGCAIGSRSYDHRSKATFILQRDIEIEMSNDSRGFGKSLSPPPVPTFSPANPC